ncbi:MAG: carboxypeptidase regulatory-like domain-containing protein [Gemmatimonadaceae bacterium]
MKSLPLFAVAALFGIGAQFAAPTSAVAQARGILNAVVRDENGGVLASARVHAMANGVDTTVRANDRGLVTLSLPYGTAQITVSMIGFESLDRDVEIDKANVQTAFVLRTVARQIERMEIRENWIGVRGIVGDNNNRQPIAGAEVMVPQQKKKVLTDSLGRFEIPLSKAGEAVVQVAREGYETRVMGVSLSPSSGTDVVLFLTPGNGPNGQKNRLRDLQQRLTTSSNRSFVAGRDVLAKDGATTIYDAVIASGLLAKNGLKFGAPVCLLVDGLPRYGFPVSTVRLADIDFIEVFGDGADIGNSLRLAWGKSPCTKDPNAGLDPPRFERKRYVEFVSVWTRKRK